MGYAAPIAGTVWELGQGSTGIPVTLTTASGGALDLNILGRIPSSLRGEIVGAYLDAYIGVITNSNAAANRIVDSGSTAEIVIENVTSGGSVTSAIVLTDTCGAAGNSTSYGSCIKGSIDLSQWSYLNYDEIFNFQLRYCKAAANNLYLNNISLAFRLYLQGENAH